MCDDEVERLGVPSVGIDRSSMRGLDLVGVCPQESITMTAAAPAPSVPPRSRLGVDPLVPPGPRGLPVFGVALSARRDPRVRFTELIRTFGDLVYFHFGQMPQMLVAHPDDIQTILVGPRERFIKDVVTRALSFAMGQGLVTSEGELWKRQRRLAAPAFSPREVAGYCDAMVSRAASFVECAKVGGERNVHDDMTRLTLDVLVRTIFGSAPAQDMGDVNSIVAELMEGFQESELTWKRLLPHWVPIASRRKALGAIAKADALLFQLLESARKDGVEPTSLLAKLMNAHEVDEERMSDQQLRDELMTLFLAGHETTASTLTCAIDQIARHPHVRERLEREIDDVVGDRPVRLEDVPKLTYTNAVIKETLRLYPSVWAIGREVVQPITLGRYRIEPGTQLIIPQWVVHRDPRWFEDSEVFRPERWLDGLAERLHRFAYFPFGGGPRVCIGNHFAMLEAEVVLATIMQSLRFTVDRATELELLPSVTLRPKHGAFVTFEARR